MDNLLYHKPHRDCERYDRIEINCVERWKESELSGDEWRFSYVASHDRDVNAATNIKTFGWLTLEKHLGVMDVAPRINKALLSGSPTGESIEAGKALRSQKVVSQ